MATTFFQNFDMGCILTSLMKIPGYGGSGFRAKEIVHDLYDSLTQCNILQNQSDDYKKAHKSFFALSVIGVGPCRTVNYLFGYKFRMFETLVPQLKVNLYVELLEYTAAYIRQHFEEYSHWSNLELYYMLCEYNKQLAAWYIDSGKTYKPTDYEQQDVVFKTDGQKSKYEKNLAKLKKQLQMFRTSGNKSGKQLEKLRIINTEHAEDCDEIEGGDIE
eukprot:12425380-Karenia_brevis.AAC.1